MTSNPTRTWTRVAFATAALLLTAAPAAYATLGDTLGGETPERAAHVRGRAYVETRLLFGTDRPDRIPAVTDAQFTNFVDKKVTPAFPRGFTVQEGRGQWRDVRGTVETERMYEVVLLYPASEARVSDRKIEQIRDHYEDVFVQESVVRVDGRKRVDF